MKTCNAYNLGFPQENCNKLSVKFLCNKDNQVSGFCNYHFYFIKSIELVFFKSKIYKFIDFISDKYYKEDRRELQELYLIFKSIRVISETEVKLINLIKNE